MFKPLMQPRRFLLALMLGILSVNSFCSTNAGAAEQPLTTPAILQELKRLRETGSVLYIAAHPDDENTQLITYLARGRGYRTAYLSLTRGDGGQNVIGPEFGAELGMIRTQELLAARRIDGAQQFFTRALDFGFSKDYRETLAIWDHQQVLGDVVRVIRMFQPDVIVTRFSPEPGGTHGHHTASAVLALEAFKLAGDGKAFPEQLGQLKPWQPKRILQNGRGTGTLQMDISGTDAVTGESFAKIAARSRAMHISQGFANYTGSAEPRPETFQLLDGEPATKDILDGVDTTWNRYAGAAEIERLINESIAKFDAKDPSASVPALLQLRTRLLAHNRQFEASLSPVVAEKRRDLDRIIFACLGLTAETTIPQAEAVPGEKLKLRHTVTVQSAVPVRWLTTWYPTTIAQEYLKIVPAAPTAPTGQATKETKLKQGQAMVREVTRELPQDTPISQPYWLRLQPTNGMARVADRKLIGLPENLPSFVVQHIFQIGDQFLMLPTEPGRLSNDAAKAGMRRLEVIPPVSLHLSTPVRLFAPGTSRAVEVEVVAARAQTGGTLKLEVPAGWRVEPAARAFRLAAVGERTKLLFQVTAPTQVTTADITATAIVNGEQIKTQRVEINYPHIPRLLHQPPARLKAIVLDLKIRGREVGYLPGAGDDVASALQEMGYTVTQLSGADLTLENLKLFDAVVIGVRTFNVRTDLAAGLPALFAYVEGGGNVIAQYNRPNDLKTKELAPFPLTLSGQRVTNENAPVTFLTPEHPALNTPNKITATDFEGWVQERGIYFPNQWDEKFTPLLAMGDPGEEPLKGGLLVARHGRGHFVYSSLVWFRQLPAGVPGAYRLFANIVSLGK